MPGLLSKRNSDDVDFELFSNTILKFTSVLMVVMVLLAINVGQKLDHIISTYRFSGGSARPQLYLGVYEIENSNRTISVAFTSPSYEQAQTKVTEDLKTVPVLESQTISGHFSGPVYSALELLAGISPGSILVDGKQTPFVVQNYSNKTVVYRDKDNKTRVGTKPSHDLTLNFLKLWSSTYANPVYPIRAFSEYKNSKTRMYVETAERNGHHVIIVGNHGIDVSKVGSGAFDFLTALSSTNTEVVYLGEYKFDDAMLTSTRIDFYTTHGFVDAAAEARASVFGPAQRNLPEKYYEKFQTWDQLPADAKNNLLTNAKGDVDLAHKRREAFIRKAALNDYRNELLETALKNNTKPEPVALPNILAYPDAWQAYVDFRLKSDPTPPEWFVTEFLQPLGFDKRVMVIN